MTRALESLELYIYISRLLVNNNRINIDEKIVMRPKKIGFTAVFFAFCY